MSNPTPQCPTDIQTFKMLLQASGCREVRLHLQAPSTNRRRISRDSFRSYDETLQYLVTMISASLGKFAALGGTVEQDALDVRMICRALDAEIYFPGMPLVWSNSLGYPVSELEIDVRPVAKNEKESPICDVAMRDVGARMDTVLFLQAFEKIRARIVEKFGDGWFKNWPEVLRFAYLLRNALAHDGCWRIDEQKGREHYQWEIFRWPRSNLTIQMRKEDGSKVDEGKPVLDTLNGADFVVLLFEIDDAIR
jgi:hypothetical protein